MSSSNTRPSHNIQKAWSPHQASLQRRRNRAVKLELNLSDHVRGMDLENKERTSKEKEVLKKAGPDKRLSVTPKRVKSKASRRDSLEPISPVNDKKNTLKLDPEVQEKLALIRDKNAPLRERVQAEVELARNPETAQLLKDTRYQFGRKSKIISKQEEEAEIARLMEQHIEEEEERARQEAEELKAARNKKLKEAREKRQREKQAALDAKKHALETIANDTEKLRKDAERARRKAEKNKLKKEKEAAEHEKRKEELLKDEDNIALRLLKEARLDQKPTKY